MGVPGDRTVDRNGYAAYIRSSAWRSVKKRYRESRLPQKCLVCGDTQFDLHHRTYKNLGAERLMDLVPLCRKHHEAVHSLQKQNPRLDLWKATKVVIKKSRRR